MSQTAFRNRRSHGRHGSSCRKLTVQKPSGVLHPRVEEVGPERFGVICFDCHKRASKWMLVNFYGKVLVEPTRVVHTRPALETTICRIRQVIEQCHLQDVVVAIERTGNYHLMVKHCFDRADFETRIVHPFATKHYRLPADEGNKTDDSDLDAIFRATLAGYGLVEQELDEPYISLRLLARHRRDLVGKRSRVCCQLREHLDLVLPGYAAVFDDLWRSNVALPLARWVGSLGKFEEFGVEELCQLLREHQHRFIPRVVERIAAWAHSAAVPHPQSELHQRIWLELDDDRQQKDQKIKEIERDLCSLLVQTPYVLLLAHPGVNVVSAAELAGEMGPIEHYPHAKCITGRAGIYPSRYQSNDVASLNGPLVRHANRHLRATLLWIADNLIKCNAHFRGLASFWKHQGQDTRNSRVKVACRFSRILYQIVGGRQAFAHPSQRQGDYILKKLNTFHLQYAMPITNTLANLQNAVAQLPKAAYVQEARSLEVELFKAQRAKRREIKEIGEIIPLLLARLGVSDLQSGREDLQDPN